MVVFWEVLEALGGGALMKEIDQWDVSLEAVFSLRVFLPFILC